MKQTLLTLLLAFTAFLGLSAHHHEEVLRIYPKSASIITLPIDHIDSLYFNPAADRVFIRTHDALHDYAVADLDSLIFAEEEHAEEGEKEVARIELVMASGHFHGTLFHQDAERVGVKYINALQKITLVKDTHGKWVPAEGSRPNFCVLSAARKISPYGLWIHYYAADGSEITGSFIEKGADRFHQHFFTPTNVRPALGGTVDAFDDKPDSLLNYVYMDTDPWNGRLNQENVQLVGSFYDGDKDEYYNNIFEVRNAIGHKGFFSFKKPRKQFDLRVRLMHDEEGKYIEKDGKQTVAPFHTPTPGQEATAHWDIDFTIPIVVYAARVEVKYWETPTQQEDGTQTTFEQLTPHDQTLVRALAAACGITLEEALADFLSSIDSPYDPESGRLWF